MEYEAVIFDMDGTLLDTLGDLANAMNRTLEKKGFPTHPTKAYRYFVGNGVVKLVLRALPPKKRNEDLITDCKKVFLREYEQNWNRKTHLYDGISKLLDALTLKRVPMAIFTNKPHGFAGLCVQEFLSQWKFEAVFGQRNGVPMKPDPTVPKEIVRMLNISSERVLYLGDSDADMKTAVNAGMVPVGALWGFRSEEELRDAGALELISQPTELLKFFN